MFEAWNGDRRVALVRVALTPSTLQATAELYDTVESADAEELVETLVERARAAGVRDLHLQSTSLLLRYQARAVGFTGSLRQPLVRSVGAAPGATTNSLVEALRGWGLAVEPTRPSGPLRQWSRKLAGGVGASLEVSVSWAAGRSFTISVPDRADLMPEAVGCCADTAGAVLRRFQRYANAVHYIYFDRSERGLVTGKLGGLANATTGEIHLNVGLVAADELVELARMATARRHQASTSDFASAPYGALDATTAHELWHQIESAVLAKDHRVGFEMRRRLGESLGVDTLEHAIKGGEKRSPPAWQEAHRRLAQEVSNYATTSPVEATAEIFTHWWCRDRADAAVVVCFGELIDELVAPPPSQ